MKKLVALFLSIIMLISCIPCAYAEDVNSKRIIYTQKFLDSVDEYVENLGAWFMKDDAIFESTLPDGKVILYYKGLKVYKEEADRVIFGLTDGLCTVTEEVIDGYVFTNPSFFGHNLKENKSGLCVYQNDKIYSIREAVENGLITVEELAEVIPFTVREDETIPPPTISTEPSTPTVPEPTETDPTDDYFEPLPTVVITPTEKPTEGRWETPTEPTEVTYIPEVTLDKNGNTNSYDQLLTAYENHTAILMELYAKVKAGDGTEAEVALYNNIVSVSLSVQKNAIVVGLKEVTDETKADYIEYFRDENVVFEQSDGAVTEDVVYDDTDHNDILIVKLNKKKLNLKKNETFKLKAKGVSKNSVIWKSSEPDVVKVNKNGKVTALKKGKAKITAKIKGLKGKQVCKVFVK